MLNTEEKKLLIKIYTSNLKVCKTKSECISATSEEFLLQMGPKKNKFSEKTIKNILAKIEDLLDEVNENKLKHKFDDRHYVEKRFAEMASKLRRVPSLTDMESISITRARIRTTHGTISDLAHHAKVNFTSYFEYAVEFKELVNDDMRKWLNKAVKENNVFTIFGVTAAPVCVKSLATVLNFHKIEGGLPVFIPMCKRIEDIDQKIIDMFLEKKCIIVLEDLDINENLKLKYVNQNEKSANPTRGFRKEEVSKSIFFAGVSQELRVLSTKKGGHPRIHFSTGSISVNHHRASVNHNKNPHSPRILRAESNHFMSGYLVEKISEKLFIPTQIMFDTKNEFTLYGRRYSKDNLKLVAPMVHAYGDIHEKEHAKDIIKNSLDVSEAMKIPYAIYHDLFDCTSGSHWNEGRLMYKAYSFLKGESSWAGEVRGTNSFLNVSTKVYKKSYIVDSNHDDMLLRALDKGNVFKDPENAFFAFLLAPAAVISFFEKDATDEKPLDIICEKLGLSKKILMEKFGYLKNKCSPLEHAVSLFGLDNPEKIEWLDLDSKLNIAGYDLSDHGHKGSNGTKGSGEAFAGSYLKMIFGHTHTPYQSNHIIGLGHNIDMSPAKKPKYAKGGTSTWMYCDAMVNDTETSHHVFTINGYRSKFMGKDALKQFTSGKPSGLTKAAYQNILK